MTRNQKQPSYLASLYDWLWARVVAAILWPLHMLGKKLVYSKIHSAIGISKVIFFQVIYCSHSFFLLEFDSVKSGYLVVFFRVLCGLVCRSSFTSQLNTLVNISEGSVF